MRSSSSFSILILFTALSLAGLALLPELPVQFMPTTYLPEISVTTTLPGTAPKVMEKEVTSLIEGVLGSIRGITGISSATSTGRSQITIQLDRFADPDIVKMEVSAAVRRIYPDLPDKTSYPLVIHYKANSGNDEPLIIYSLTGSGMTVLQQYA